MLPDGTLESFDYQYLQPFRHWSLKADDQNPAGLATPGSPRQKRANDEPVTVRTAMDFIDESLARYQAYRIALDDSGVRFQFPYAVFLDTGTRFRCIETKEIYKIEYMQKDAKGKFNGIVDLKADSGRPLRLTDRLVPFEKEGQNSIRFMHAWPKSMPKEYEWNEGGDLIEDGRPFTDTITWTVVNSQPGSIGRQPFTGTREIAHRFREVIIEQGANCDYARMISGQVFDNIVQFDIWSQTPKRAYILLEWFNQFMLLHRWVFLYNGVQRIYFWKQLSDALSTRWRNDIVNVSVQWYFRTENVIHRKIRRIRDISLEVEALTHGEQWQQKPTIIDPAGCIDPTGIINTSIVDGTGQITIPGTGILST